MATQRIETWMQYAFKIKQALMEVFNEDNSYYIDSQELKNPKNATAFIHALATAVPTSIYNGMSNNEVDCLEFNHIANQLCFQFCQPESSKDEDINSSDKEDCD